jgi:predicted DCC family thiol-disulfide oxidoreductase YuxK
MEAQKISVFYDGLCIICSREIDHYRKSRGADRVNFVDICNPSFDPVANGLDPFAVHKVMHVRRVDGTLATEVDAFIEIWKTLPGYRWLASIASVSMVRFFMNIGYQAFVKIRPFLPRRSADIYACADSPYCDVPKSKNDPHETSKNA